MARLHIYPHNEPQQDLHIVADPAALRALGKALIKAAQTPQGFERVKLHTSDGHEYTAMIVADVSEAEWQTIPPAYSQSMVPKITALEDYQSLRKELQMAMETKPHQRGL
jgi:2-C-methyl-D-erythritol 4-phosphate cytidylyltransferase